MERSFQWCDDTYLHKATRERKSLVSCSGHCLAGATEEATRCGLPSYVVIVLKLIQEAEQSTTLFKQGKPARQSDWLTTVPTPTAFAPETSPPSLSPEAMADYNRYGSSSSPYGYGQGGYGSSSSPYGYGQGGYGSYPPPMGGFGGGAVAFPPGTHPEVERAFRAVDRDGSGTIDERELQDALSSTYHRFSIRTVRLLISLFSNPASPSPSRMGPAEFVSLWNCLGQWRGIFDRYDRDRSGKIDSDELREALRGLGYAVPPSVIEVLVANYNNGMSSRGALDFDNLVECGMIVKGLTEKFKEKDTRYSGSATLTYDGFLSMVIPFIVP